MANGAERGGGRARNPWRIAAWSIAALLLLLPLVAMRFTEEVSWTVSDFLFAGLMIAIVGATFELAVRMTANIPHRAAIAVALAAAFLTIWANGAVGMIGDEDNPFNLLFFGVIALALGGAVVARFRPAGMALAMVAAAVAQAALGVAGFASDPRGGVLSAAFGGLWLLSAALFRKAAREQIARSA
jgi:hypothetical protein